MITKAEAKNIVEKYGIKTFYEYAEERKDRNTIVFGWKELTEEEFFRKKQKELYVCVVSRSAEETSIASFDDYEKFFQRYTNYSCDEFLKRWPTSEALVAFFKEKIPEHPEENVRALYMMSRFLSRLEDFATESGIKYTAIYPEYDYEHKYESSNGDAS